MRVAVRSFTAPLTFEECPVPGPHTDQVLVHSPCHEGAGLIEEVGPDVDDGLVGARVAVPWLALACGTCAHCVAGWATACEAEHSNEVPARVAFAL